MEYAVLISYQDPNDATNAISIILNTVNDTNITASSTVTEHPTLNGTPMSDHMYKNPIDLTLRGVFSANGQKALLVDKSGTQTLDIHRVEKVFENIKDLGVICVISKIKIMDKEQTPQFTVREHMVLQSISWTERINSISFSFNFREALRANVQTYEADPDDRFAPDITYAEASAFSDTLLDWDAVDKEVLQALANYKLITNDFLQLLATQAVGDLIALGVGAAIATVLSSTLTALGATAAMIPVIGVVITVAAAAVIGIFALIRFVKQRAYKIKAFKYYKNATQQDKEVRRFLEFYTSIHDKIKSLDGAIKVWAVSENKPQETIVNIDGSYYIFNFEKNNVDSGYAYKLNISNASGQSTECTNINCALESFTDGTDNNTVFKTSKSRVYLICTPGMDRNDLTSYFICASQINPLDFANTLVDIIQEAIKY